MAEPRELRPVTFGPVYLTGSPIVNLSPDEEVDGPKVLTPVVRGTGATSLPVEDGLPPAATVPVIPGSETVTGEADQQASSSATGAPSSSSANSSATPVTTGTESGQAATSTTVVTPTTPTTPTVPAAPTLTTTKATSK